mgnify:CR=1 FL=1
MRLLKIGRDASCDIVLHSDKVSSLHAELTLLNSGDITLEDKGSHNGTFIMNRPIKPGKPVNVRRGDAIRFADVELQWSQIPQPEDNSAFKGVYGIGSHFNNDFQIAGATVSRYHATVKQGKDGKMYIIDHSKNGTTVDGTKIQSNTLHRIKKSSAIVCGGVPVDLSRLPWPSSALKYIIGIAASILVLVGIGFGVWKFLPSGGKTWDTEAINNRYNSSVVMMVGTYHYEVTIGDMKPEFQKLLRDKFGLPRQIVFIKGEPVDKENITDDMFFSNCSYAGTGFFISDDGQIVTNLHVAKPWLYDENVKSIESYCRILFAKIAETNPSLGLSAYTSQLKVEGKLDRLLFIPQGKYFSNENAVMCKVISAGDDTNKDVALVQSEKMELPNKKVSFVNITDSMDISDNALKVGKAMFTIGFPYGIALQDAKSEKGLQVFCHMGHISQASGEFGFNFDAVSGGGASGSPIFNDKGMLIGVLHAGVNKENITEGIKAKYIKELIDNPHENKE